MLTKFIPRPLKRRLRQLAMRRRWRGAERIFCISVQRTGTTSVGDFFEHHGYPVARSRDSVKHDWTGLWDRGDHEALFNGPEFNGFQVFEDDPWWLPDCYRVLFHRFPEAKFILFVRDSEAWFKSMVAHSGGMTLGNTRRHVRIYRREAELYWRMDTDPGFQPDYAGPDRLLPLNGQEEQYRRYYETRNREVIEFFEHYGKDRLVVCDLSDADKWQRVGAFVGIDVPDDFSMHSHRSKVK